MLLSVFLPACSSWYAQPTSPRELIVTQHPRSVRVIRADHSSLVVAEPEIRGDTLYGLAEQGLQLGGRRRTSTRIPLDDVEQIAVRKIDPVRTGLAGAAVAGVAAFVYAVATQGEE
jgi:hypothetical protein